MCYLWNLAKPKMVRNSGWATWSNLENWKSTPYAGMSGTIIRGTLKTSNSQLVTPISIKLQRPDGCD
jgi:hypothetical protein